MSYEYATENINYEDYASGRVLYNQKGTTSYPARLISEIFQRCVAHIDKQGIQGPYSVYDQLCGGAYALTILGFLHHNQICNLIASDIDSSVVEFARKNLSLLTNEGMRERILQIKKYLDEYGKESHKDALDSADRLQKLRQLTPHRLATTCFQADALKPCNTNLPNTFDMVITDVPYGEMVDWFTEEGDNAITILLQNLLPVLSSHSIVAISAKKRTTIINKNYTRVEKFNIGKRQIVLLRPII